MDSTTADAAIAYHILLAYATQDMLSRYFVEACMAIAAWESNGFDRNAHNIHDPGPWGSAGLWQINSEAYPDVALSQATNPFWSTWYWLYHQGAERIWRDMDGEVSYPAGQNSFLRTFAPRVQGSDPWTYTIAKTALDRVGWAYYNMVTKGLL